MLLYSVLPSLHVAAPHRWSRLRRLADPPEAWPLMVWIALHALLIITLSRLLCFSSRPLAAPWRTLSYRRATARQVKFYQRRLVSPLQFVVSIMQPAK